VQCCIVCTPAGNSGAYWVSEFWACIATVRSLHSFTVQYIQLLLLSLRRTCTLHCYMSSVCLVYTPCLKKGSIRSMAITLNIQTLGHFSFLAYIWIRDSTSGVARVQSFGAKLIRRSSHPFSSLFSLSFPFLQRSFHSSFLSQSSLPKCIYGSGEQCKLPQHCLRQRPGRKSICDIFATRKRSDGNDFRSFCAPTVWCLVTDVRQTSTGCLVLT